MRVNQNFLASVIFISLVLANIAQAQTDTFWNLPASGSWTTNTNWNPAVVPNNGTPAGSTYNAIIQAASGSPYTVTLSLPLPTSEVSVSGLLIDSPNATLAHTSGVLIVDNQMTLTSGQYNIRGGTLSDTHIFATGGSVRAGNAQFSASTGNFSNVICDADIVIENGTLKIADDTQLLRNIMIKQAGNLSLQSIPVAGVFSNYEVASGRTLAMSALSSAFITSNAIFTLKTNSQLTGTGAQIDGTGRFVNEGRLTSTTTGGLLRVGLNGSTMTVVNQNIMEANGGASLTITAGNLQNNGTIHAKAGSNSFSLTTITLNGNWTNNGIIQADNNSRIILGGNFTSGGIGSIARSGNAVVHVVGAWNNAGSTFNFSNTGKMILNGGGITGGVIDNSLNNLDSILGSISNAQITGGLVINEGTLIFRDNATFTGVASLGSAGTLQFAGPDSLNPVSYSVDNAQINLNFGKLSVTQGAALTLGPSFVVSGTGELNGGGLLDLSSVTNRGNMQMSGSVKLARFSNEGDLIIPAARTLSFSHATSTFAAQWNNKGHIVVNSGSTLSLGDPGSNDFFDNSGLIEITGRMTFSENGLISQSAGETRLLGGLIDDNNTNNRTFSIAAGALTGNGIINANLLIGGTLSPGLSTGLIDVNGSLTLQESAMSVFEIGGIQQGSAVDGYDFVDVLTSLAIDGQLLVNVDSAFQDSIMSTDVFTIMASSGITGEFDNAASGQQLLTVDGKFQFSAYYGSGSPFNSNNVVLTGFALAVPEPQAGILLAAICLSGFRRRRGRSPGR